MNRNDLLPFDEVDYHSAITTAVKAIETLLIERRRRARFLPEWTVEHRSKGIASIRKKLQRKQAEKAGYTAASMTDIAGVRVIVESAFTAKKFAQYVRDRMLFTVREEDSEEFIDSPRGDGYRGIHIVLAVRVKRVSVKMVPV